MKFNSILSAPKKGAAMNRRRFLGIVAATARRLRRRRDLCPNRAARPEKYR